MPLHLTSDKLYYKGDFYVKTAGSPAVAMREKDGSIWYFPPSGKMPQLLQDEHSVCGLGDLNTGFFDPERPACGWHDTTYLNYRFFENLGWDRKDMDDYFLNLALVTAGRDAKQIQQAHTHYALVRAVGWLPYYYRKLTGNTLWN